MLSLLFSFPFSFLFSFLFFFLFSKVTSLDNCLDNCFIINRNFSCSFYYNSDFTVEFKKVNNSDIYTFYRIEKNDILQEEQFIFSELTKTMSSIEIADYYSFDVWTFNNTFVDLCLSKNLLSNSINTLINFILAIFICLFLL